MIAQTDLHCWNFMKTSESAALLTENIHGSCRIHTSHCLTVIYLSFLCVSSPTPACCYSLVLCVCVVVVQTQHQHLSVDIRCSAGTRLGSLYWFFSLSVFVYSYPPYMPSISVNKPLWFEQTKEAKKTDVNVRVLSIFNEDHQCAFQWLNFCSEREKERERERETLWRRYRSRTNFVLFKERYQWKRETFRVKWIVEGESADK